MLHSDAPYSLSPCSTHHFYCLTSHLYCSTIFFYVHYFTSVVRYLTLSVWLSISLCLLLYSCCSIHCSICSLLYFYCLTPHSCCATLSFYLLTASLLLLNLTFSMLLYCVLSCYFFAKLCTLLWSCFSPFFALRLWKTLKKLAHLKPCTVSRFFLDCLSTIFDTVSQL